MPTRFRCHQGNVPFSFSILLPDVAVERSSVLANAVNEDNDGIGIVELPRGTNRSFFDAWLAYIQHDTHPSTVQDAISAIQVCAARPAHWLCCSSGYAVQIQLWPTSKIRTAFRNGLLH